MSSLMHSSLLSIEHSPTATRASGWFDRAGFFRKYPQLMGRTFSDSVPLQMKRVFIENGTLHSGEKTMTRRYWGPQNQQLHLDCYFQGKLVRVWRGQGHSCTVGWVLYTNMYYQNLMLMSNEDVKLEGFPGLSVQQFIERHMSKKGVCVVPPDEEVLVINFKFFPFANE